MKIWNHARLIGLSMLLALSLAACDNAAGPAESAGQKIDQTASAAGEKIATTIDKVGEAIGDQSARTGAAINDAEITTKVKAAIFAEPGLTTLQIGVDTVNGVVTLSGSVDSPRDGETARSLAGAVSGVKSVENGLVIKPRPD